MLLNPGFDLHSALAAGENNFPFFSIFVLIRNLLLLRAKRHAIAQLQGRSCLHFARETVLAVKRIARRTSHDYLLSLINPSIVPRSTNQQTNSTAFGTITTTLPPGQIEFALKLKF